MQHFWKSSGLEESVRFITLNELSDTFPAPAPPEPVPMLTGLEAPKLNESSSIQPAKFWRVDSPVTPSKLMNMSVAMIASPRLCYVN
jgi:hypothetical protein